MRLPSNHNIRQHGPGKDKDIEPDPGDMAHGGNSFCPASPYQIVGRQKRPTGLRVPQQVIQPVSSWMAVKRRFIPGSLKGP